MNLDWRIQHARTSVFFRDATPIAGNDSLFSEVAGLEPDVEEWRASRTIRRRAVETPGFRLELIENPGRLDCVRMGAQNLDVSAMNGDLELGSIGRLEKFGAFAANLELLCKESESVIRLALGGLLYLPTEGATHSYEILAQIFPALDLSYKTTSDFTLQVNRFTESKVVPGLRINRVSAWNGVGFTLLMGAGQGAPVGPNWVQVTIDINTDASRTSPFSNEEIEGLRQEMINAFLFIANGFST